MAETVKTIKSLSPELLVKIFSYVIESEGHVRFLKNISPVCKSWYDVSAMPSLWKRIEAVSWENLVVFSNKGLLYHIESLKIPENVCDINRRLFDLSLVIPNILKLKDLDLSRTNLTRRGLVVVARHCSHLERLTMVRVDVNGWGWSLSLREMGPVLAVCGWKLKHLDLSSSCYSVKTEELVADIGDKCPQLEEFRFQNLDYSVFHRFPLHKLETGCPKLRKLEFTYCDIVTNVGDDGNGFENIEVFRAGESNFHGLNLYYFLKNSTNLEHLELISNENLNIAGISDIPSDKLRVLEIWCQTLFFDMSIVKQAVKKWKNTLSELHLRIWNCNTSSVLEALLDNPNPRLESLTIGRHTVNLTFLKTFVKRCQNLNRLLIVPQSTDREIRLFENREELLSLLNFL